MPEPQLTEEQEAAVDNADNPSGENPFITQSALPEPQLTEEQEAAIDAANSPNASNPFLTRADVPRQAQYVSRAAGWLRLDTAANQRAVFGGLALVEVDAANARIVVTFSGYDAEHADRYIVNALTVHGHESGINRTYSVELVNFSDSGITFHMNRYPGGVVELAPECMFEISEIVPGRGR